MKVILLYSFTTGKSQYEKAQGLIMEAAFSKRNMIRKDERQHKGRKEMGTMIKTSREKESIIGSREI